jgi:hypothetical protein
MAHPAPHAHFLNLTAAAIMWAKVQPISHFWSNRSTNLRQIG